MNPRHDPRRKQNAEAINGIVLIVGLCLVCIGWLAYHLFAWLKGRV